MLSSMQAGTYIWCQADMNSTSTGILPSEVRGPQCTLVNWQLEHHHLGKVLPGSRGSNTPSRFNWSNSKNSHKRPSIHEKRQAANKR